MIDLRIDLLPAQVSTKCEYVLGAVFFAAGPPRACGIQAVSDFIIVRRRHLAENLVDKTRRIHSRSKSVPSARRRGGPSYLRVGTIRFCGNVCDRTKQADVPKLTRERVA